MRITRRRPFHLLDRQLEVSFYTSNLAKFLQARMVFERSGLTLRHLKSRTDPYQEDYEAGKTELLKRAIAQVQLRIGHDTPFFVEDTSLRIEALSPGRADFPGLRVKEWFQQGGFEELDSRLRREGNDRSAVVKSDIALHLPGLDQPAFFHGETRGAVADSASVQTQPPRYPWLGSDTFNAWFIPEGAIRRLSDMDFEVSCEHDFRVRALVGLLERLAEYTAALNLPAASYRRRTTETSLAHPSLFEPQGGPLLILGQTCAGKTTFAEVAVLSYGCRHVEASSIWRMLEDQPSSSGSDALEAAQGVLKTQGPDFIAKQIVKFFGYSIRDATITGFRTIQELLVVCEIFPDTAIVWVEAAERTRFERHLARARYPEVTSPDAFRRLDDGQQSFGLLRHGQDLVDVALVNEDSLDDYMVRVRMMLSGAPVSAIPSVSMKPSIKSRRERSQLCRCLSVLREGGTMSSREISTRLGKDIATRNVNKVLSHAPELVDRYGGPTRFRYEIAPAGLAYVRFLTNRSEVVSYFARGSKAEE